MSPAAEKTAEEITGRLREKYGELLTTAEAAEALRTPTGSLRVTMRRSGGRKQPWIQRLIRGRRRLGRRVFFAAEAVADAIAYGDDSDPLHQGQDGGAK